MPLLLFLIELKYFAIGTVSFINGPAILLNNKGVWVIWPPASGPHIQPSTLVPWPPALIKVSTSSIPPQLKPSHYDHVHITFNGLPVI